MLSFIFPRDELIHPEIEDWWLMDSFWSPTLISIIYLLSLTLIDKLVINGRAKYDHINLSYKILRAFVYGGAIMNSTLLLFFLGLSFILKYNYYCEPPSKSLMSQNSIWSWVMGDWYDERTKRLELVVAKGMYIFFITKLLDYVDHCALVLRNDTVQKGQVIHHVVMVWISWFGLKFAPGGSTIIWIILNCTFLSVAFTWQVMTYYASGNAEERAHWRQYKHWVILIKNMQFFFCGLHCLTIMNAQCGYPRKYAVFMLGFVILIVFMNELGGTGGGSGGGSRKKNVVRKAIDDNIDSIDDDSSIPATDDSSGKDHKDLPNPGDDSSDENLLLHPCFWL